MNIAALAFRYLWARPLSAALNWLLLSLGLASMSFLILVGHQLDIAFERDLAGIDMVVGAKGSPLQLILAGVFHLDTPTGNVPQAAVDALRGHPLVAQVIPLSLGDSLRGFRIVGTTRDYPAHYQATLAAGQWWGQPMQAVLGAQVAAATGLKAGDSFEGAHGLDHRPQRVENIVLHLSSGESPATAARKVVAYSATVTRASDSSAAQ